MLGVIAFAMAATLAFGSQGSAQNSFGQIPNGGGFGQAQNGGGLAQPQTGGGLGQMPNDGGFGQAQSGGGFGQMQNGNSGMAMPGGNGFGQNGGAGFGQPGMVNQGGFGGAGGNPQMAQMFDQLAQYERQDLGVAPVRELHNGPMHGATPSQIPGGQVITTKGLFELIQGRQMPYLLFDALGSGETLPGAIPAAGASTPGDFNDALQNQFSQFLQQVTQGNRELPLIFYCESRECWMSYNAALRAIAAGYTNVLWYRGGLQAWKQVGGPTIYAGGNGMQQGYGGQQPGAYAPSQGYGQN